MWLADLSALRVKTNQHCNLPEMERSGTSFCICIFTESDGQIGYEGKNNAVSPKATQCANLALGTTMVSAGCSCVAIRLPSHGAAWPPKDYLCSIRDRKTTNNYRNKEGKRRTKVDGYT
ncbi:hypothetical protein EYF80_055340 [Liparis tanakae]|uniref:Uncharacterized protein n=1 Tax=Liparis tanakae TaxID=230148 RepID=A0A4Z2F040_9TELE|nr:hypothetical protein EYF80_055340 [Liparis tanakae]